ncbi:DUF2188 domain-containing protein [Mesorhizobium sp. RP14(2022)]|uniref:DUF2188 domain-containing protein n=1 Tax=Mesorhizobium liriopis TaxID=2953882 RepID=A0ABT1C9K2_9HYPH|nr:DUF2188 domain-containing protein [Mesorhizobium liriopis]MCO6050646.1 DUF2188 domain-containing protein [Mesorhizobium liriopis]
MKLTYEIVEHNDGWAYKVGDTFSETFDTHDQAAEAARRAASEQQLSDETHDIEYEDADGEWHEESSEGDDRPETEVKG